MRICLPTARRFNRMAFQCPHIEAQDVLAECEGVDLVALQPRPGFASRLRWLRRLMYRDVTRRLAYANPGLEPVRLERDYDLLVVMCQGYWDFLYVNALEGWRERCATSVVWIDELWAADLPHARHWLPSLRRFDHVVVGMHGTVDALSDRLERRCHYVPAGIDAVRFTPLPDPPARVVDVYSVGRRVDAVHEALLAVAEKTRLFYQYDTLQTGISEAAEPRAHRELYAGIAKRSRLFLVAPGKVNLPDETRGQIEIGFRYYEGAAAGTVMIGQAPDCEPFGRMFDWPDAIVPLRPDGSDVAEVVTDLVANPERVARIGTRNAREALLRHDWVHRWKRVLEIAGLAPNAGIEGRERTLRALAEGVGGR